MNKDRGIIKWLPFNSIVGEQELIEKTIKEKNKIKKPHLSQEQMEQNEQRIIEAFYEQEPVKIFYFQDGVIKETKTKIINIDSAYKKIYLKNQKTLLFLQIIKIIML